MSTLCFSQRLPVVPPAIMIKEEIIRDLQNKHHNVLSDITVHEIDGGFGKKLSVTSEEDANNHLLLLAKLRDKKTIRNETLPAQKIFRARNFRRGNKHKQAVKFTPISLNDKFVNENVGLSKIRASDESSELAFLLGNRKSRFNSDILNAVRGKSSVKQPATILNSRDISRNLHQNRERKASGQRTTSHTKLIFLENDTNSKEISAESKILQLSDDIAVLQSGEDGGFVADSKEMFLLSNTPRHRTDRKSFQVFVLSDSSNNEQIDNPLDSNQVHEQYIDEIINRVKSHLPHNKNALKPPTVSKSNHVNINVHQNIADERLPATFESSYSNGQAKLNPTIPELSEHSLPQHSDTYGINISGLNTNIPYYGPPIVLKNIALTNDVTNDVSFRSAGVPLPSSVAYDHPLTRFVIGSNNVPTLLDPSVRENSVPSTLQLTKAEPATQPKQVRQNFTLYQAR